MLVTYCFRYSKYYKRDVANTLKTCHGILLSRSDERSFCIILSRYNISEKSKIKNIFTSFVVIRVSIRKFVSVVYYFDAVRSTFYM